MKSTRWRLSIIAAVIALSVWAFYPPAEKVNLGLDLKGGVHLVLAVHTEDALRLETETTAERLRDDLTRAGVAFTKVEVDPKDTTQFRIEGAQDDRALRDATATIESTFDRSSGPGVVTFKIKPNIANQL